MKKIRDIFKGGEDGFTLIELLVVIAVLGILAAIAIPRLGGVTDKAKLSEGETILGTVKNAAYMYYTEEGSYPSSTGDISQYIDNISDLLPASNTGGWAQEGFQTSGVSIQYYDNNDLADADLILNLEFDSGKITTGSSATYN